MPLFKEDQIMIISPGTHTTLAQLGLPESFTPAQLRVKSRMFPAEKEGEWEPCKVRQRERKKHVIEKPAEPTDGEAPKEANGTNGVNGEQEEPELYEDWETDEGAVWAMNQGRVVNWSCFYALLTYVYNQLSPHASIQTPLLLIGQPCWSQKDHEQITQFFFERFKCPGLTIVDSASAALYGFNVQNACVVDIGYQKADITAISDFEIQSIGRTVALPKCGGEAMTQNLLKQLAPRKFTRDMCEQLKQSPICEILLPGTPMPGSGQTQIEEITNPAAAASTGATGSGPGHRTSTGAMGAEPRGPGEGTEVGDDNDDNEGVLDVASIVTGGAGKMEEFLAKKEREKAEKAARKKGESGPAQAKIARIPNSQREKATFMYRDNAVLDALKGMSLSREDMADAKAKLDEGKQKPAPADAHIDATGPEPTSPTTATMGQASAPRREIEVGIERFQAASDGILERIADAIHHTISAVDVVKRAELWDSLILVGRGSRIRGFREALMQTIISKYLISPSSATIFTSELPSNFSTPVGTGAQTPQPQLGPPQVPHGSSVNPLLLAATTASNPHLQPGNPLAGMPGAHTQQNLHSSHGQTPTSVKWAKNMDYFPEWKEAGCWEEAHFLGAQVAAKILFISAPGDAKTFMSRMDYNEMGPSGIHQICF